MGITVLFFIGLVKTRSEFRFFVYIALFAACLATVAIDALPNV